MSGELLTDVRRKFYLDSVALMRHSKVIAERDDVIEAAMMMGTPANRQIMLNAGLLDAESPAVEGGDLLISVRAQTMDAAEAAMVAAAELLDQPATTNEGSQWRPRSMRSAVSVLPDANLALISVAGDFAISEARKAIRRGLHAMIFSDNVPLDDEVALKREALALGRLVMGPDCGTSIINGVPLAFANKLPRGDIGIVGASGTGIQEVSCLIAANERGISHAIGVGGRDLKSAVGGISTLMALEALGRDAGTRHIVVISKPPAEDVVQKLLPALAAIEKPVTLCFVGGTALSNLPANIVFTDTLKAAAEAATGQTLKTRRLDAVKLAENLPASRHRLVGLYCGGTLCAEAQVIAHQQGAAVASNVAIPGVKDSGGEVIAIAHHHVLTDLGDDQFTQGRPHPMIEPSIRDEWFLAALAQSDVCAVLVDVVIGYGAHADPAGQLVAVLKQLPRQADSPLVIASVTGTADDPQQLHRQVQTLEAAGIVVAESNADAVALGLAVVQAATTASSSA